MFVIETTSGRVRGFFDRGVPNWRGIPYGSIPARFQPARPATAASAEPIDTTRWGPVSWQVPMEVTPQRWSPLYPEAVQHEECLNLNIWSARPDRAERQPVLVWFHPGRHMVGGTMRTVDPWAYAGRHDLVVVTANYRLGPWGWLPLAGLDPKFDMSTNLGVRDQLLLLEWVRDNIAGFGGDPGNVTLFGLSTGASDVATLLGIPAAAGLFHQAAVYSGHAELAHRPDDAAELSGRFLTAAGDLVQGPGDLPDATNVALRYIHSQTLRTGPVRYQAVIDGDLVPAAPLRAIADRTATVPVLVSVTSEEAGILEIVQGGTAVDTTYAARFGTGDEPTRREKVARLSAELYVRPAERLLNALHTAGGPCWAQVFDYHPSTSHLAGYPSIARRAVHAADTSALFCDTAGPDGTDADRVVGAREQRALVGLARRGDPGWPAYSPDRPVARWIGSGRSEATDLRPLPLPTTVQESR
ncbi:carboxylesterase family protein [Nocardia sp. NEAU-G5]|uniref:Carboxylic ester hydrolase n=1 Tax=Nocardia albiluteola TaxID=2842303 RepID=A0ABS6BE78_9NOCA|nr:carboxylesterase family protein [Nocardia albiluteola]MBU3068101.1 carboxylesterase family protein [Nocardia albiluteola]